MVSAGGETDVEPFATGVTAPMLWSIENDVALPVVHESEDESPVWMAVGLAVRTQTGGGGGGVAVTVTAATHVAIKPPEPNAVPVYVVVTVGETECEPAATGVT